MHVCVIGAGVVGIASAYSFARRGHRVTVLDETDGPGRGTSYANGGQLSYSYVAPLADPSIWGDLPKYLVDPDSPLTLRLSPDIAQWTWMLRFLLACNSRSASLTTAALLQLAFFSRQALDALRAAVDIDFGHRVAGKLVMLSSRDQVEKAKRQVELQATLGCEQEVLSIERCIHIEPALLRSRERWAAGVYTPSEEVGDCARFCDELARVLRNAYRVQFEFNSRVTGAISRGPRIEALKTAQGEISADLYVMANGAGASILGRQLGLSLPVYPLKGYSVTMEAGSGSLPRVSITDLGKKIVYARLGDRLRVAGRAELVGHDDRVDAKRCEQLAQEAMTLFSAERSEVNGISPWAGLRPATPSGKPIIGTTPINNLMINVGHGALGWTLACGSGELLARMLDGEPIPFDHAPFRYR